MRTAKSLACLLLVSCAGLERGGSDTVRFEEPPSGRRGAVETVAIESRTRETGRSAPTKKAAAKPRSPAPATPAEAPGPEEALSVGDAVLPSADIRIATKVSPTDAPVSRATGGDRKEDASGSVRAPEPVMLPAPPRAAHDKLTKPAPRRRAPPKSAGVKAGAFDDNLAFNAYLNFLDDNAGSTLVAHDVAGRIIVQVQDAQGRPVHDARVALVNQGARTQARRTYTDGRAMLFAGHRINQGAQVVVSYGAERKEVLLSAARGRHLTIKLDRDRNEVDHAPLDIAFVLDTTGSMGDELNRLRQTLDVIHFQITHIQPRPDVRFGMVLYRDVGDDYRVRKISFTSDVAAFRAELAKVQAGGGGDYPEDVQAGLEAAMHDLKWRETGVRLAFLIGDAPPQVNYGQTYTYVSAMQEAARRGIKIAAIGASGLSREGEVAWRQIAQYTMAPFVFLTNGETGNSEGSPSSVSHHVGSNWVADNLDAIIVRMVKSEMAHLTKRGAPVREDFFSASAHRELPADGVLEDLFTQSVRQLLDYSVEKIDARTPTVILPLSGAFKAKARAQLSRRLQVGLARTRAFQLLERESQPRLLATIAKQLGDKYDEAKATEVGRLVPAKLAVLGHIAATDKTHCELMIKLVRLETGEVLSLSLLKIDRALLM